jgi:hypothetical protein
MSYKNTPFDYSSDYDDDPETTELDFMIETFKMLYVKDVYRTKDFLREAYATICCRDRIKDISDSNEEFNDLDQALNFFHLVHTKQHKKREVALDLVSKTYKVSKYKIECVWNSYISYKAHFGKKINFIRKKYKRTKRHAV